MHNNHLERSKALVSQMTLAEKMAQMVYDAPEIERLDIAAYNWWNECLHGVARSGTATVFPQAIGMAATFNAGLMHEVACAISDEVRAKYNEYRTFGATRIYQGLTCWSPNINIYRDPRWGRGHETYGEDPCLTAIMGTAFVRGLQGDDPECRKVDATLKHYAVHSGPESERHGFDARVSLKDLYETYLAAFRICIARAQPAAVMGAYNRVNGEACCASPTLLQQILFGEFGFDGYVVSDCGAICDINRFHGLTADEAESAALAVNHGCSLNCGSAYQSLKAAVLRGLVDEETITAHVEKLFAARYALGMMDDVNPYDCISYDVINCNRHQDLAVRMARESMVLLKNDGILPLSPDLGSIAVIGPNLDERSVLLGNYNGHPDHYVTLYDGICQGAPPDMKIYKARGCELIRANQHAWVEQPLYEALIAARKSDVVVLCLGLRPDVEGEEGDAYNSDLGGDRPDIELPEPQCQLFEELARLGKPMIIVNTSGGAINFSSQHERASAIIQAWYPGQSGGIALADILFGRYNPSGKLPVTFYRSTSELPPFKDYAMQGRTYRYMTSEPLYPFGFGLGYSTFRLDDLELGQSVLQAGDGLELAVRLTNLGPVAGQETIQVYLSRPQCPVQAPQLQLTALEKVSLQPGESRIIRISVDPDWFLLVDETGCRRHIPGNAVIKVGCSQPIERSTELGAPAYLEASLTLA